MWKWVLGVWEIGMGGGRWEGRLGVRVREVWGRGGRIEGGVGGLVEASHVLARLGPVGHSLGDPGLGEAPLPAPLHLLHHLPHHLAPIPLRGVVGGGGGVVGIVPILLARVGLLFIHPSSLTPSDRLASLACNPGMLLLILPGQD